MKVEKISSSPNPSFYRGEIAFVMITLGEIPEVWLKNIYPHISHLRDYFYIFVYPEMRFHPDYKLLQHFNLQPVKDKEVWRSWLKNQLENHKLNVFLVDEIQYSQFAAFIDALGLLGVEAGVFVHDDVYIPPAYLKGLDKAFEEGCFDKYFMICSNMVEPYGVVPYQNETPFKDPYERIELPDHLADERLKTPEGYYIYAAACYVKTFAKKDWREIVIREEHFLDYFDVKLFNEYADYVYNYFTSNKLHKRGVFMHLDGGHVINRYYLESLRKYYDYLPTHTETFLIHVAHAFKWRYATLPYLSHAHIYRPSRIFSVRRANMDYFVGKQVQGMFPQVLRDPEVRKL